LNFDYQELRSHADKVSFRNRDQKVSRYLTFPQLGGLFALAGSEARRYFLYNFNPIQA
jgi:hypothetical protein